jgi:hypothetical protein
VRPSQAFAAVLMATSLAAVAVAVPAYADSSSSSTNPTSTSSPSPSVSPSPSATPTAAGSPAAKAAPAASSSSASAGSKAATSGIAAANPLAGLTDPPPSCTAALGGDPTKLQTCLTDAAAAAGLPTPPAQLGAVTTFLTCAAGVKTTTAGEACAQALFKALGIPNTDCLDPALKPILNAIDALITNQDPSALQEELSTLPNKLPTELSQVQACLTPAAATTTPAPTPTATPSAGTSEGSGAAVSDPTVPVAVAAEPTFTG